ncbi:LysR family transcriptional regulator [Microbacterium immunditiarum]|uniref:DNA-binding transcriptional LysR family regulator n=1 Tax=Microbacterium immunditiarum TaxID=337480 RepID=A0A7Y9GMD7_9MICO|nr:LysR family transcriptional regulator [Microbacterium immunditiarum]NYE18986.1 DNA-binding transcriptional LysR family regulator [Microbacterium immunditiarum]
MDVRALRYAITLADELHFGRAASRHFIAAQPFGRRIQDLERDLGTRLFDRTSRRVTLTVAGERFLLRARRVLADLDALEALGGQRIDARDSGTLRVGVLGFGLADRWRTVRGVLEMQHPGVRLAFVELDWQNQYELVRTGDVDVAIVHDVGGADGLRIEPALLSPLVAVVPRESELAEAETLDESELDDRPRVRLVGHVGLAAWGGGPPRRGDVQVRTPSSLPAAVAVTGHIGVHGEQASRYFPHPDVRYVPMSGPDAVVAVASRPRDDSPLVTAFRTAVQASEPVLRLEDRAEARSGSERY